MLAVAGLAVPMMDQRQKVMPDVSGMTSFVCMSASGKGTDSSKRTIVERNAKRTLVVTPSKQAGNSSPVALSHESAAPALEAAKRDWRIST